MEKVTVIFKNGQEGDILKSEYEANKDKDYIVGLKGEQKELKPTFENKELKKNLNLLSRIKNLKRT